VTTERAFEALQDRYRLLGEIGKGGMATVYRVHDLKHDRTIALKVLHDDLAASLGPERFKREILIAARLQHPHVLSVFDSGEAAGRLWFTMPYVSGESLRDRLRRDGKLPVDEALRITREASLALSYAHKQGVIHRDIKPENILLTEDGTTLVADFGIARAIGDRTFDTGLTQTGSTIGTPTYMAPEQATNESVLDERVDQYALAAVLYETLTGAPPFTGSNAAALIAARFTTAITPVRTHRAEVPADVDAAVQRALALKPFDRFPTITEFARAVAPAIPTPPEFDTLTRARQQTERRRPWLAALAVVTLVAVAGAGLAWRRSGAAAAAAGPVRIAVLPLQNLGDSADAYFADGMSDELRAKLVNLPGVQVIARASSVQFAGTAKAPPQIAEELGVRYLLTGTLRYERHPDGSSEVHLRPELMEVSGRGPAITRWQAAFDEPLRNAAALQARIAEQVAAQLRVTLGSSERTELARPLTANPAAYDAYLRAISSWGSDAPEITRQRVTDLERAVTLDPQFAMAWAELVRARSQLRVRLDGTAELAALARQAAERARDVAPGGLADHMAWYWYYRSVAVDNANAEKELRAAQVLEPNNPANMARMARLLDEQGRFAEARPLFEAATQLDPLNVSVWANYSEALLLQRRYVEARAALDRRARLAPVKEQAVLDQVMLAASMGDLDLARRVIQDAYRRIPPEGLDVYLATYLDYGWILDDAGQRRVLAAPVAAFDGNAGVQMGVRAQILHARGDLAGSRQAALQAIAGLAATAKSAPDDTQWLLIEGFAAALAGQREEAERLIRAHAVALEGKPMGAPDLAYFAELRARIRTLDGDYDRAFDELEAILSRPGYLGRGQLALDPIWAPLRALPRYQRLMATASSQEVR
jgi:serine/threonine-protein kinase